MSIAHVLDLIRCPLCRAPFVAAPGRVRCTTGHAFDLARQGYLNLLGRAAPPHADTVDMVAARSRFLDAGYFGPVSTALAGLIPKPEPTLLDVGAGGGHYLAELLSRRGGRAVALDISPAACRRAARVAGALGAVVADAWAPLPLIDHGFDAVLSIFAPRQPAEFARVLARDGRLLVATPLPEHLAELREALQLLDIQPDKEDRLYAALRPHFTPAGRQEVRLQLSLDPHAVQDVVAMGPNAFHRTADELRGAIESLAMPQSVTGAIAVTAWAPARPGTNCVLYSSA